MEQLVAVHLKKRDAKYVVGQLVQPLDAENWPTIAPGTAVFVDGKLEIIYGHLKDIAPESLAHSVEQLCRLVNYSRNTRMTPVGAGARADGKLETKNRMVTIDTKFGFRPQRAVYGLPAGPCDFNSQYPQHYGNLALLAEALHCAYASQNPERFNAQQETMKGVRNDCRISNTLFTQGVINKANILPYHYDSGNFPAAWSAMVYFTRHMEGGDLLLPELSAKLVVRDHAYVLFDGQGLLHGVAPARGTKPGAYRYSLVYYALQLMAKVGDQEERLEKIRHADMVKHNRQLGKGKL